MELRIHISVSAIMSGLWLSVRSLSVVTCSGVSIERVLRMQMRRFAGWADYCISALTSITGHLMDNLQSALNASVWSSKPGNQSI